ncbi:hypothetical protein IT570_01710 [Candidatus Sumerlaeota bacterium]|nr:hypothetical protein [Candidatus Sumerlaeota bacterium]
MQTLSNFAASQFAFAVMIALFALAMGAGIVAKFDSKWGYVLIVGGILFGLLALRANRII